MSTQSQNYFPFPPDFNTWISLMMKNFSANINCHSIGTIQKYNRTTKIASISINYLRVIKNSNPNLPNPAPDGQLSNVNLAYPLLVNCPVMMYKGGGCYIDMPIQQGDTCLVLFNDRETSTWLNAGGVNPPQNERTHDLSDAIAIVGILSLISPIINPNPPVPTEGIILAAGMISMRNSMDNLCNAIEGLCNSLLSWTDTHGDIPNNNTALNIKQNLQAVKVAQQMFDTLFQDVIRTMNNNSAGTKNAGTSLMGG